MKALVVLMDRSRVKSTKEKENKFCGSLGVAAPAARASQVDASGKESTDRCRRRRWVGRELV